MCPLSARSEAWLRASPSRGSSARTSSVILSNLNSNFWFGPRIQHTVSFLGRIMSSPALRCSLEWQFSKCMLDISLSKFLFVHNVLCVCHRTNNITHSLPLWYINLKVQGNASTIIYKVNEVSKMFIFRNYLYSIEPPELNYL